MKFGRRAAVAAVMMALSLSAVTVGGAQEKKDPKEKEKGKGFKQKSWDEVTDAAVAYLKATQAEDGTWSKASHPGITAVVVTGLLKSGKVKADDPMAAKGLRFVETLVDDKEGSLAAGENLRHKFYVTSVNLQAFKASGLKKYDAPVDRAVAYLKKGQTGAADGKKEDDPNYGGFGYGPGSRGDMSNTHFVLDALVAAGVPRTDDVYKKTLIFVSRCQNLGGEHNKLPWADKINDGSFVYVNGAGFGGAADAPKPGYGSMTFAGLKSLAICGVSKDDPRYKKALEWVGKNYSVDVNPGRQEGAGGQGYYYYLVSMAKCLHTLGVDEVTDASGKKHDWRAEITRALTLRQKKDGSWGNDFAQWLESDPNLDTAFALIALSYTRPKK
ncbi:MAG: terpene cyclase/mutase family protein [Planctomycetes bacterium]|nr:terpene cyclase/mutase family protein [Planctomycetota bacterium]